MDLNDIKNQVSNLTLYDIKAGWRKAQNAVMNYTEMEAKVREATNNEPWGSSTSLMQEIANGTFNYSTLSEIMPMIYKRFTEKSAEEWRQIYKALQLLEFLIKNGSERVVDDARSHLSLLKMLRQFHFIDQNGKDQGINVRNRAKELAELLGDVDRIRSERKKSRQTRNKYTGSEGGMGLGGGFSGGSSGRYGGFGSETEGANANFGGYSGGVYGDGGGFGGRSESDQYDAGQARRDRFEEYDEYDDGGATAPASQRRQARPTTAPPKDPPKPKQPEVDLFDFGDDDIMPSAPAVAPAPTNGKAPAVADDFGAIQSGGGDDDFDDFQAAPSTATTTNAASMRPSQPAIQPGNGAGSFPVLSPPGSTPATRPASTANYGAFKSPAPVAASNSTVAAPTLQPVNQPKPTGYQPQGPNYFGSVSTAAPTTAAPTNLMAASPAVAQPSAGANIAQPKKPASGGDPFAALMGGGAKKPTTQKGPTMADMAKQKASQGIWGAPASQQQSGGGSSGDLI